MSIHFSKINGVQNIYKNSKVEAKKEIKEASAVQGKKDQVQFSKEAMDFQTVLKSVKEIKDIPDIRADVIAPIKEKLDKGTYQVDGKNLAEKMLAAKMNLKV